MRLCFGLLALCFSINVNAVPAKLLYYKFFGDYLSEKTYQVEVNLEQDSIRDLKALLQNKRTHEPGCSCDICTATDKGIDSNLVIVGYGEGYPEDFFMATENLDQSTPLENIIGAMPKEEQAKTWHIYFIDRELSTYVTEKKTVHPTCPFKSLSEIGQQKLRFFE